jgi:hypothetical protein
MRRQLVSDHEAVAEMNLSISAGGDIGIVGDHDERGAGFALASRKQVENMLAVDRVEVAGRLVGEDDGRVENKGAGKSDALLFSAGKLDGVVVETVGESDTGE